MAIKCVNVQSSQAILRTDGTQNNLHATRMQFTNITFEDNSGSLIQTNVTCDESNSCFATNSDLGGVYQVLMLHM